MAAPQPTNVQAGVADSPAPKTARFGWIFAALALMKRHKMDAENFPKNLVASVARGNEWLGLELFCVDS